MRYSVLLDTLQNLTGYRPTQAELCRKLDIKQSAMAQRAGRDSDFSLEELQKLERIYAVSIITSCNVSDSTADLNYYPNVFGSCGTGLTVFDETSEKISVTKDLIANYSASNQYSVISAKGSSMAPLIIESDKLIIQHNLNEQIIDDTVYLFKYNDELFIKRLVKNVDQIVCISENPRFEDRIITPNGDNFSILGKVVGLFRSKV